MLRCAAAVSIAISRMGQPLTNAVADTAQVFRKTGDFKQVL
jgi:hypothetical protein